MKTYRTMTFEAYGAKGLKSTPWRKTFRNQFEFEKWLEKNEGNIDVYGTRELEDGHGPNQEWPPGAPVYR